MKEENDGISKVFWEVELKKLNDALPKVRQPISDLLMAANPSYTNVAGENVSMDKAEISQVSKLIPNERDGVVRLPFVIIKDASAGKGVYCVDGNLVEVKTINAILGKESENKFIYRPEILEICNKFPTLIVFGFLY